MKSLRFLLLVLSPLALTSALCAAEPSATATSEPGLVKPVITKVVYPTQMPRSFTRDVVTVQFGLDESGRPRDVTVVSPVEQAVKRRVVAAFQQWRFEVAALGMPVESKRFSLPIDFIPRA